MKNEFHIQTRAATREVRLLLFSVLLIYFAVLERHATYLNSRFARIARPRLKLSLRVCAKRMWEGRRLVLFERRRDYQRLSKDIVIEGITIDNDSELIRCGSTRAWVSLMDVQTCRGKHRCTAQLTRNFSLSTV